MRREFRNSVPVILIGQGALVWFLPVLKWTFWITLPLIGMGIYDYFQTKHTIRRNFPLLGRMRYWLELIRPEVNQYFIESNTDGRPFNREQRSVVYQRAKHDLDTLPFGTQNDVYQVGYEWINHSMVPKHVDPESLRIQVGGVDCSRPYSASIFNISAMSYGSLSANAILALNGGAKDGNFAHNTGEGGISPYHLEPGGDLIWQVGTGYFGCRSKDGKFDPEKFQERSQIANVKMVEIKISQGAKPGHGGILPAKKVTEEISKIRDVPMGVDVVSPPSHSAFSTPIELCEFISKLRDLCGGKPVGIKLCIGKRREFLAFCKAMLETGITPDFISVDGGEGGTGAAPIEFSNHLGTPAADGLIFVHNALVGFNLRDRISIFAAGKVTTAFGMLKMMALGADIIYSARAMMMALGCIQALRCNANICPAGVATQDPDLTAGLVVSSKRKRVLAYHEETVESVAHLLGAVGLERSEDLRPWHVMRRISAFETQHYGEIYNYLQPGELLGDNVPSPRWRANKSAAATTFEAPPDYES